MEETVESLQTLITHWVHEQQALRSGIKPSKEEIEATQFYQRQTALLVKQAVQPAPDQCKHFQRRQARFCTKKRTAGDDMCGLHRPSSLSSASASAAGVPRSAPEAANPISSTGRKTNIQKRMKRMLNPFKITEIATEKLPDWPTLYADTSLPLMLDIGCAKGRYIGALRQSHRESHCQSWKSSRWNFCGVEIFAPIVEAANQQIEQMSDIHYVHANINRDFERLNLPNLQRVSFLFPDPWSCGANASKKNEKKRVMSPSFASRIAKKLAPGVGDVYIASDWLDLALDIRNCLIGTGLFDVPRVEDFEGVCGWSKVDKQAAADLREDEFKWRCTCAETPCKNREQEKSHISRYPFIPTLRASQISKDQHGKQHQVSQVLGDELIDVQTEYAKPEVDASNLVLDDSALWLEGIPFDGVQTERDLVCESQWRAIYRLVLYRNNKDC
ncbi:putative methyltransferase-domain-containing protein [Chytriomyces cf. hyalinus JEL632]|nr:putative methyltransferase-domain-containing protein [Chytriomyces cf. hyalinus JEL632]